MRPVLPIWLLLPWALLVLALLTSLTLISCSKKEPAYETYVTDIIFGLNYNETTVQYMELPTVLLFDRDRPEELDVTFEGKVYHCTRTLSYRAIDWQTDFDYYDYSNRETVEREEDIFDCTFSIDLNGNVVGWYSNQGFDRITEETDDLEPLVTERAKEIASKYISVDEYRISVMKERTQITDYGYIPHTGYYVRFIRYIGDLATSEKLTLIFSKKGVYCGGAMQNIGVFKDVTEKDLPEIDYERIDTKIMDSLKKEHPSLEYRINDHFLARAKNGQLLLVTCLDTKHPSDQQYLVNCHAYSTVLPDA